MFLCEAFDRTEGSHLEKEDEITLLKIEMRAAEYNGNSEMLRSTQSECKEPLQMVRASNTNCNKREPM
jgi:hypothetical protein